MKTFEVTQDYDPKTFADFIYDFLPEDYSPKKQQAYFDYTNIEEGYKLGTCKSLNLDVYEFRTKSKRDPRVTLTREVVSLMKKYGYNIVVDSSIKNSVNQFTFTENRVKNMIKYSFQEVGKNIPS